MYFPSVAMFQLVECVVMAAIWWLLMSGLYFLGGWVVSCWGCDGLSASMIWFMGVFSTISCMFSPDTGMKLMTHGVWMAAWFLTTNGGFFFCDVRAKACNRGRWSTSEIL